MRITLDLDKALRFLKTLNTASDRGASFRTLLKIRPVVQESFERVFSRSHSDTVHIGSKDELRDLIRGGTNHVPRPAEKGDSYNSEYLELKAKLGENSPHKFWNYGFWNGTSISVGYDRLVLKTTPIYKKGYNYLAAHENRRSVLKRTFLDGWQRIIKTIIRSYAREARLA